MSVSALLAPEGVAELRAAMAERRVLRLRSAIPVEPLLPWPEIEKLKHLVPVVPGEYYVGFRGGPVPRAAYRDGEGRIKTAIVQAFLDKGASLVLNQVQRRVPAVDLAARNLAGLTGRNVFANAYLTYGAVSVFAPHRDRHDVLALQIHGAKRWILYAADGQPGPEILLESGDLLFVPEGECHEAVPVALPSVHLSFGLLPSQAG